MPWIAGAVVGGASLLGGMLGRGAAKEEAKRKEALYKQSVGMYGDFYNDPNSLLNRGERSMRGAMGAINTGFGEAQRYIGGIGSAARRTALTQGARATAGMQQSMASRGLYGTTAYDNASRGISSDISRNLMQIDAQVGQTMASLSTQRAGALASAYQSLGAYQGQAYGQRQNSLENYINLLRDRPQAFNSAAYFGNALGNAVSAGASVYGYMKGQQGTA